MSESATKDPQGTLAEEATTPASKHKAIFRTLSGVCLFSDKFSQRSTHSQAPARVATVLMGLGHIVWGIRPISSLEVFPETICPQVLRRSLVVRPLRVEAIVTDTAHLLVDQLVSPVQHHSAPLDMAPHAEIRRLPSQDLTRVGILELNPLTHIVMLVGIRELRRALPHHSLARLPRPHSLAQLRDSQERRPHSPEHLHSPITAPHPPVVLLLSLVPLGMVSNPHMEAGILVDHPPAITKVGRQETPGVILLIA